MKKYLLMSLVYLIVVGCEDCSDDGEVNNLLTDYERTLIPFSVPSSVRFVDETSEIILGNYTKKENIVKDLDRGNDEECFATNIESEISFLNFADLALKIQISVGKGRKNRTDFNLTPIMGANERLVLQECDGIVENIESMETDVEVDGYMFSDVFVFKKCDQDGQIDQIVYSSKNGVEFIDFADGSYLKLEE